MSGQARAALVLALIGSARPAASQAPRWRAVLAVEAGALDGPGALAPVFDVEIGPGGEMLAGQPGTGSIAVFGADGAYLRSVGRRGQGPGEFRVLGRMGWLGDTLWVVDFTRLHLFDRNLEFARSITFPTLRPPTGVGRVIPGPLLADGSILGIPVMVQPGRAAPIVRLSSEGEILDTLAHVPMQETYVAVPVSGSARPGNISRPWIDNPLWMVSADGRSLVVVNRPLPRRSDASTFELVQIDLRGDTILHRRIEYEPVEWERAQIDAWYTSMAGVVSSQLSVTGDRAEQAVRQATRPPRYHLPVTGLVPGRDGSIWLRRDEAGDTSVDWQVFDEAGRPIGLVALPGRLKVQRAERSRVWGVAADSLDVPYLRVYEIAGR